MSGPIWGIVLFHLRESLLAEQADDDPEGGGVLISYPSPLFVPGLRSDLPGCPDLEGVAMRGTVVGLGEGQMCMRHCIQGHMHARLSFGETLAEWSIHL